jgi:maltokinase
VTVLPPRSDLTRDLAEWLPRQRWFGGKDGPIDELSLGTATELRTGDPALHHLVLDVRQNGTTDHYQVLLGVRRELPERLLNAEIGRADGEPGFTGHVYDAVHDPELSGILLDFMASETAVGPLRFRRAPGTGIRAGLEGLPTSAEQSNTSLIFDDAYICKLFRRLSPGVNPDLEVNLALSRHGCEHIPAVHGWIELDPGTGDSGEPVTLAMLSEFLRTGTDGWQLALTSVRDWFAQPSPPGPAAEFTTGDAGDAGGDFAAEAERLGAATAQVHRDLAAAFGVTRTPPEVLRTESGWALLDFEGEPARAESERRALAHPLRDVAGMLRSFEYAARFLITKAGTVPTESGPHLETRAHAWAARNRAAFCRGYAAAGGADPAAHSVLMHAFEFEKAVYEVRYEARNRPAWLPVPLTSLAHLTA